MKRFDVQVTFYSVDGESENDALDRVNRALYAVSLTSDTEIDVDYMFDNAWEVSDGEEVNAGRSTTGY